MSDEVKVAIRVRPLIERENLLKINRKVSENTIFLVDPSNGKPRGEIYTFDHIFDASSTNSNVFEKVVKPLVDVAVKGNNAAIFAYGQTSSGKTHTMLGNKKESGIIQLAVQYMLENIKQSSGCEFIVRASFLEIYNEKVSDLLEEGKGNLEICEMDGNVIVVNLKEDLVASTDKIIASQSSKPRDKGAVQVSHLNLVDLAGSERADQSGAPGDRLKEGCAINRSLFMLGHVISKLCEGHKQHINFHDSKRTRILQPSLGGKALILITCTVTPAIEEEILCTLGFASQAKIIRIEPHVNEFELDGILLQRYAHQLVHLRNDFQDMKMSNFCQDMVSMESELWKKYSRDKLLPHHLSLPKSKLIFHGRSDHNESKKRQSQRRVRYISRTCHRAFSSVLSGMHLETIEEEPSLPHSFSESDLDLFCNELYLQLASEEFELELVRSKVNLDCTSSPVLSDELIEEPIFMSHPDYNKNKPVCSFCLPVEDSCDVSCQTEFVDSLSEANSTLQHELQEQISFWQNECELQRIEFEEEKQFALWEKYCMSDHPQLDQHQHLTLPNIIMEENTHLREEVTKKNALITDLQEQLCRLQANHSELWQAKEALQALLETNCKLLESLSQKNNIIDNVNEKCLTFQELHSECLNSIEGKNNRIKVLEEQLSRYAVHVDEKDNRIQELTEELSKYDSDITGKNNKIEVLEEELSRYVAHLREKDNRMQVLEEQLSRYSVDVVEKDKRIHKLTEELSKYASDITGKDNKIEVLEEELSRYVIHLREKDNRIQELKEKLCKNAADIDEKNNRILELADLLSSGEEQLQQYQKLNSEKDIRIQDLAEKVIAMEAIMSMAQELGNKAKTDAPEEDTSCSEKCLPVSPEKHVTDDLSLEECCENIERRRFNPQLGEHSWYLNISDIEQAIGNMQKRIFELKKKTEEFDSVYELFPNNRTMCTVLSKEIAHADGLEKILEEGPINAHVYNESHESTRQHLFDTEVETCLKSENCYLKSLLLQILTEIRKKQLQLSQTMDEREKMNTEVKSLRNELQKLQLTNNNNSSLSVYDVCLELLKQQNIALKDSLDEIRSYRKCLVNEVIDLDPSRDQQSLQECELMELLGAFNECIMKKEEEVFSDLQSRCEELAYDNSNMTQLIQVLEKKIHDKDKEIKSLTDTVINFQTDNEKLVSGENRTHTEELGSAQLQKKLIKEEANFLTAKIEELGKIETFSTEIQHLFNMIPELDSESDLTTIINTIIEKVNLAKTLNEEMLVLKNNYDELNQKNNSLRKHIECLEMDLQEKEEENKEFVCNIKKLQNDKEVLTIKFNEKVRTVERLEQEVQLVHGELTLAKQLKEEAESFNSKSLRLEKLELIIGEIKQLSIFIPELESHQDSSLLTVIPLIKQKLSAFQKISEKNVIFKEQLTELKEECYKMKNEIENLELDIQRKTYDNNEMKESLRALQNDKESLLLNIKNQTQCLEILRQELNVAKSNQMDIKDLRDELLTKSQQLEKLEIINVEIQQLITSALEWNVSPDCDLVTTVHLLIQKIGHAEILAEDTIQYKDNLKESEIQCEKLKNHIKCLEQEIQEKNTKIKELANINNNLQSIKDKHVLQIVENQHCMHVMEEQIKVLQSELNDSKNGLTNKAGSVEVIYGPARNISSISRTDINGDVTSLDNMLIENAEARENNVQCHTSDKKCKNQKVTKPVHSMNRHENDISSKIPQGAKEMNDTIPTLQANNNRLQHQVQFMRKEIENVIADRRKLELQMGQKDKEIEILQSGRKKFELEVQCLKKRSKSFIVKQKEVKETIEQQRQEIEKVLKERKDLELQYLQMKKECENMLTDREKFREEVTRMKKEIEKLIREREMHDYEIESLKVENGKLKCNVQHLKELETAEKKMKELFASIPEIDSSHSDFESVINIISEKINSNKSQKQDSNTNIEKNTQTMYNRLKRQVRDLDKIKNICLDLEDKVDCLEECKKALEMRLREKTNAIDQLEGDKINLLRKINHYSEKLQITERYLTQLGYKWDGKLLIYCAPPMLPDVKVVQLRVKELEEEVLDLKMELKQKNFENEGAFNLATDLDKTKSEYETKYRQIQIEMRNLQNQMHCFANNGMMKNIYKPSNTLVSVAVNTDEAAEYKRYKFIENDIHHPGSEMDDSDIRTSICKHKVDCGELMNGTESKNLEKCLEEARSQINELSTEVKNLRKKHRATLIQALKKMKDKTVQTDEESLVLKRLCSEGSGIVSEHELLQALERVKKLEKEKKMLKALSRERLLRLYIAEGKIKPLTSSKSTVPRLSPEKLSILNRYTRDVSTTTCESGTKKSIISDW